MNRWAIVFRPPGCGSALHVARVLEQVLVDVFAENDLLLHRDSRVEIHLQIAKARRAPTSSTSGFSSRDRPSEVPSLAKLREHPDGDLLDELGLR